MKTKLQYFCIVLALFVGIYQAAAQGTTAFTYQGQLHDNGTNANGAYTMTFALYDSASGGTQIGTSIISSPTLANGLFTVNLDFGASAFNGTARYLNITVSNGVAQTLSPRVQVLPTPYAQFAAVAATVTNGAIMNAQLAGNAVNATNIQNSTITTAQIAAGAVTNANLTANAVATTNIQNNAVTDAKIVSVSGTKISGTVASAASLTNGPWSTSVGTYVFPNAFIFSASGTPQLAVFPSQGVGVANNLYLGGQIEMGGNAISEVGTLSGYNNLLNIEADMNISGGITVSEIINAANISAADVTASSVIVSNTLTASEVDAGSFNQTSDRNLKEKFTPIDNQKILERVARLPISSWNFKQGANTRHIGPMAQDFYSAFNVGMDDKHIATVDESGVALAAIQGLNEKLKKKDAEFQKLKSQNESLEKRLADLEQLVKTSAQK